MLHQFAIVWDSRDLMLQGCLQTLWLSVLSAAVSLALGALLSTVLMSRRGFLASAGAVLVDAMRCVPFLLFAYIIYYGLPSVGLDFNAWQSGLIALVIYNTAYMAELIRASWRSLPAETIEAGHAFGFHGLGLFRRVILPPVIFAAAPMIGNQVIQIIKDSAFLTIITVEELTHAATVIQAKYFLPFASFLSALMLYWLMCLAVEQVVRLVGVRAELRR
jgi:polar amino acid transport system permease protein